MSEPRTPAARPDLFTDLAPEIYDKEWKPTHDRVFCGRYAIEGAFRDPAWQVDILPHSRMDDDSEFEALVAMVAEVDDTVLVIKDAEIISPPEPARLLPVSFAALDAVWRNTILCHFETHLFGRSAAWGVVFTVDDFTLVAGQPGLMERFTARLGGRERL